MSRALERTLVVRCSVTHAFDVFSRRIDAWWPTGHRRFDGSTLRLEPRAGGRFVERSPSGEEAELGAVVRWEPPGRLTYTWFPGAISGPTLVDVRFVEDGDATRVEVTHHEGEAGLGEHWASRAAMFERGWGAVLPAFARFLEETKDGT